MSGVLPQGAGSGKRSLATRSATRTSSRPASIFSARATIWCAAAAFDAFAPNRAACSCSVRRLLLDVGALLLAALLVGLALAQVVLPAHVVDVDDLAVGVEVEDLVDGRPDELDVVADHDDAALVALEELAQPDHRVGVEVVGRLVEDHRVGAGEQDAGELDAAALAAREGLERLVEDAVGQREVRCDRRRLGLGRVAAERQEAVFELAVRASSPRSLTAASVARHLERRLRACRARACRGRGRRGCACAPCRRGCRSAGPAAGSRSRRCASMRAAVGLQLPREGLGERRLAGAVAPDEPDLVALVDAEGHVLHEHARADADLEVVARRAQYEVLFFGWERQGPSGPAR